MRNSPPALRAARGGCRGRPSVVVDGGAATARRVRLKNGGSSGGKKKQQQPLIDLTAFGFSRKKRPVATPLVVDTAAATTTATLASSSLDVEIIVSSTKRSRRDASSSSFATGGGGEAKVGLGKENPAAASSTSTTASAVAAPSVTASPAKKASFADVKSSSSTQRVALLDLTQTDSSSSSDNNLEQRNLEVLSIRTKHADYERTTATMPSMADAIAGAIRATTNADGAQRQQQPQHAGSQRRGKRDKQQKGGSRQRGVRRPAGSMDVPITIFEDDKGGGGINSSLNPQQKQLQESETPGKKRKGSLFTEGTLVAVQDRTWPGRNDQGGVARILAVHPSGSEGDGVTRYDLKYVIEPRKEMGVEEHFMSLHSDYVSPSKSANARNGFATKRPPVPPASAAKRSKVVKRRSPGLAATSPSAAIGNPMMRIPTKRKASPAKAKRSNSKINGPEQKKSLSPQQMVRGGSIQSYLSAATVSASPSMKNDVGDVAKTSSPEVVAVKTSPKASPKANSSPQISATVAYAAKPSSPTRPSANIRANALGLVRVPNPHEIPCMTAVAQVRQLRFRLNGNKVVPANRAANGTNQRHLPQIIFPGAVLGRTSNTSKKMPNFVDLGIKNNAAGISRNHVKVLSVRGVTATKATSTTAEPSSESPSLLIQVHENSNNGVQLYFAQRGERKKLYLGQAEQKSLRIGDAIEFYSNKRMSYCVVGLLFAGGGNEGDNDVSEGMDADATRALEIVSPQEKHKRKVMLPIERDANDANVTARKRKHRKDGVGVMGDGDMDASLIIEDDDGKEEGIIASSGMIGISADGDSVDNGLEMEALAKKPENVDNPNRRSPLGSDKALSTAATMVTTTIMIPGNGAWTHDRGYSKSPDARCKSVPEDMDVTMDLVADPSLGLREMALTNQSMEGDEDSGGERCESIAAPLAQRGKSPANNENKYVSTTAIVNKETSEKGKEHLCGNPGVVVTAASTVADQIENDAGPIQKGDDVKVLYEVEDKMFGEPGECRNEWYFGTVTKVFKTELNTPSSCCINFDENSRTFPYPFRDIVKLTSPKEELFYPEAFNVGDVVEAQFQDGKCPGKWCRGRIASVNKDGSACDICYYDGHFESSIPTKEKKVRLIQRCDPTGQWLIGKTAILKSNDSTRSQTGVVSKLLDASYHYQVTFSELGSHSQIVAYEEVAKAVFNHLLKHLARTRQHVWPVSLTRSMADTVRLRRQRKLQRKSIYESANQVETEEVKLQPKCAVKESRSGRTKPLRSSILNKVVKEEPVDMADDVERALANKQDDEEDELCLDWQGGPAVDPSVLEKRRMAKDFPPGLPNVLWCALNSPEAQTGSNFLGDLLWVHDSVPPFTLVQKLMELMKYGPKAEGSRVHFKDPYRTELAAQYIYCLVAASSKLVRRDSTALFGPSSWDDIEVLLSQSIAETENMISGRRLAQGLQLAARGARLLSLMLTTELQGHDLFSASYVTLDLASLKAMPTIALVRTYGVRSGLKAAVQHATKCLVRHSRWILDQGGQDSPYSVNDECCALEAKACLDSLGSAICVIAWLFCTEVRAEMGDPECAFVVKDEFLVEMERSLDELPEMNECNKKILVKRLKMHFLLSLTEDFATRLVATLSGMIGVEDELALVGLVA